MKVYCDIDGILADSTKGYSSAKPIQKNIDRINALYDKGWTVIIWTARGMKTNHGDALLAEIQYGSLTKNWLQKHGVKFHKFKMGKPSFDKIIDDKSENWSTNLNDEDTDPLYLPFDLFQNDPD